MGRGQLFVAGLVVGLLVAAVPSDAQDAELSRTDKARIAEDAWPWIEQYIAEFANNSEELPRAQLEYFVTQAWRRSNKTFEFNRLLDQIGAEQGAPSSAVESVRGFWLKRRSTRYMKADLKTDTALRDEVRRNIATAMWRIEAKRRMVSVAREILRQCAE